MALGRADGRTASLDEAAWLRSPGLVAWLRSALFGSAKLRHATQEERLDVLRDAAEAVSVVGNVDQTLELIVDSVKRIIGTDKAILVLCDENDGGFDTDSLVVRGSRSQHEQEWWERRLMELGSQLQPQDHPLIESHPDHKAWLMCCPVAVRGANVGLLCAVNGSSRPFTQHQKDSMVILSVFAAGSIESARWVERMRSVHLAGERDRIAREMHDGVVQSLFSISLGLEVCKKRLEREPMAVAERLDELQIHLNSSMTELRRFIYDLRPVKLAELGLIGAVEFWVSEITMSRTIQGHVVVDGRLPRLTPTEEAVLYRVAKEAVSNAVRHSGPTSVTVSIDSSHDAVRLSVEDDGEGFDVQRTMSDGEPGIGLGSIQERVASEGGFLEILSEPGVGTTVVVTLPLRGEV